MPKHNVSPVTLCELFRELLGNLSCEVELWGGLGECACVVTRRHREVPSPQQNAVITQRVYKTAAGKTFHSGEVCHLHLTQIKIKEDKTNLILEQLVILGGWSGEDDKNDLITMVQMQARTSNIYFRISPVTHVFCTDRWHVYSRPGRPPKRSLGVAIQENARLLPHGVPGLLSPGLISPTACCLVGVEAVESRLALGEMDGSREVAVVAAELAALSGGVVIGTCHFSFTCCLFSSLDPECPELDPVTGSVQVPDTGTEVTSVMLAAAKTCCGDALQAAGQGLGCGQEVCKAQGELGDAVHGLGLTAAAMAEAMKLQKMKLMAMNSLHGSGSQNGTESENEELNSNAGGSESSWDKDKLQSPITTGSQHSLGHPTLSGQSSLGSAHPLSPLQQNHLLTNRIDLPFMMMPHPLLPVSLPPASVAMAMNQMNHLNTIANMAAAAQMHSPLSRAGASVIKERIQDSPSPAPSLEDSQRPGSHASSHPSSSVSSSPSQLDNTPDRIAMLTNSREGELIDQETGTSLKKIQKEKEEEIFAPKGLLKVAVDNARVQEKQIQQEKKELKMELCRERELRESLERQLTAELQSRATIQKRLKKEKKAKRKLQEALEFESKRREQVEQALKQATSDAGIPDMEIEHNGTQHDSAAMQENRTYIKPTIICSASFIKPVTILSHLLISQITFHQVELMEWERLQHELPRSIEVNGKKSDLSAKELMSSENQMQKCKLTATLYRHIKEKATHAEEDMAYLKLIYCHNRWSPNPSGYSKNVSDPQLHAKANPAKSVFHPLHIHHTNPSEDRGDAGGTQPVVTTHWSSQQECKDKKPEVCLN
ncbi:hypothetical protein IHE44_0003302 [Lamprotornis superbus]|uniref:Uncharacterized protein n=1 Tax=Lamprotornis superbus TaxID=245042 RepID=A0A835NYQ4_9PASS|nr:hypothetical protein IHE44_0003302 [Lamprotornis superbus]